MSRMLGAVLTAACALSMTACSSGAQDEARQIIDPQGTEFQQALTATRARFEPTEATVRGTVGSSDLIGTREEIGCVLGNKGPKGDHDVWDSECDLRRSFGLRSKDAVVTLLAVDKALKAAGYRGTWYAADAKTELRVGDRSVRSAVYVSGGGGAVRLQVGRVGEKQLFLVNSPRAGYFERSTGEDWESVAPRGSVLNVPIVAVELRVPHFIRRPVTA